MDYINSFNNDIDFNKDIHFKEGQPFIQWSLVRWSFSEIHNPLNLATQL